MAEVNLFVRRPSSSVVPRPRFLSEEDEKAEETDRRRLHDLDGKIDELRRRRLALVQRVRELSQEQKALFDQRKDPHAVAERLHGEHQELGRKLSVLRGERDRARKKLEELVARAREVRAEVPPTERVRPDRVRQEIHDLEVRQQTQSLTLAEENALIDRMRERTKLLRDLEAHETMLKEHEKRRKEAEAAIVAGRSEVDRISQEYAHTRADREGKMAEIRSELERAGTIVAQMRGKALERRGLMEKLDASGRELGTIEGEARKILQSSRARRDEARAAVRAFAPRRGDRSTGDRAEARADARLEELLKRGKVSL